MQEVKNEPGEVIFMEENDPVPPGSPGLVQGGALSMETIRTLRREALLNDHLVDLLGQYGIRINDVSLYLQFGHKEPGDGPDWCVYRGQEDRFRIFIRGNLTGDYQVTHVQILPGPVPES